MRTPFIATLALLISGPAFAADEPSGFDKFKWPIERERAALTAPDPCQSGFGRRTAKVTCERSDARIGRTDGRQAPNAARAFAERRHLCWLRQRNQDLAKRRPLHDQPFLGRLAGRGAKRQLSQADGAQRRHRLRRHPARPVKFELSASPLVSASHRHVRKLDLDCNPADRTITARPQSLICPSWQETYFALRKNFSLNAPPKSNLQLPPSCPEKRGVGHRHERWDGLRWTRQRRARGVFAGRFFRERTWRARRTALKRFSRQFFPAACGPVEAYGSRKLRTAKACGPGTRCWCQADGDCRARPGLRSIANPSATEARGIRLRGEHGISRKTTAQGRPGVPAHLRSAVCILAHDCGCHGHPAFPAPSILRGHRRSYNFGRFAPRDRTIVSSRAHLSKTAISASGGSGIALLCQPPVCAAVALFVGTRTDNLPSFH